MAEPGKAEIDKGKAEKSSKELFLAVFQSEQFIESLKRTAKKVRQTGLEHAFVVTKTTDDEHWYSPILRGSTESMKTVDSFDARRNEEGFERTKRVLSGDVDLLNLHFHPNTDITPSSRDLDNYFYYLEDTPDIVPIAGLGVTDRSGNINLLLYQAKINQAVPDLLLQDLADEIDELRYAPYFDDNPKHLPTARVRDQLVEAFTSSGFSRALILTLRSDDSRWSDGDLERLNEFLSR